MDEDLKQLLLLCKRLNKFTLNDVLLYADFDEESLKKKLLVLQNGGYIKKSGHNYIYESMALRKKSKKKNKQLPLMFQHHTPETIDLIVKCFCAGVCSQKTSCLVGLNDSCITYFFREFKKLIYNNQFEKLLKFHKEKPQTGKMRNYFDNPAYFYIYDNQVYVAEKLLQSFDDEVIFTKEEKTEFKKIHCYLKRIEGHHKHKVYLHLNLAERLWRREMEFGKLKIDLKALINASIS